MVDWRQVPDDLALNVVTENGRDLPQGTRTTRLPGHTTMVKGSARGFVERMAGKAGRWFALEKHRRGLQQSKPHGPCPGTGLKALLGAARLRQVASNAATGTLQAERSCRQKGPMIETLLNSLMPLHSRITRTQVPRGGPAGPWA